MVAVSGHVLLTKKVKENTNIQRPRTLKQSATINYIFVGFYTAPTL